MKQTRSLFRMCDSGVTTPVSHLTNEFDVRASELGSCQPNLCNLCGYEQLQKSKNSLKDCFENVNIYI